MGKKRTTTNERVKKAEKDSAKTKTKPEVIASRKSCRADGTGLSHFILMDKKADK